MDIFWTFDEFQVLLILVMIHTQNYEINKFALQTIKQRGGDYQEYKT